MASSLMNDNNYTYNICNDLISMAQTLFITKISAITLSDKEIAHILKNTIKDVNVDIKEIKYITQYVFFEQLQDKFSHINKDKTQEKLNSLIEISKGFNKKTKSIIEKIKTNTNKNEIKQYYEDLEIIKFQIKKIVKIATSILDK
jgi:hypothetical protein